MDSNTEQLELANFFPYQLAQLNASISRVLAQLYADRFNLSPIEWKVLAALGENTVMTAKEIAVFSSMDKMQVSRALTGLKKLELVLHRTDKDDRRCSRLSLSHTGQQMYRDIVPLVKARESFLLDALSVEEQAKFAVYLDKITEKAASLEKLG